MKKNLSESQAWGFLAKAFSQKRVEDGSLFGARILVSEGNLASGLCVALYDISNKLSVKTYHSMKGKLDKQAGKMGKSCHDFLWSRTARGDKARVRFCLEQAKISKRA